MKLVTLSQALNQDICQLLFGAEGVNIEGVEEVGVELDYSYDVAFVVGAFLELDKEVFPYSRQVYGFYGEDVVSQPSDYLHFAVAAVVEELEDHHLIFQKMKDNPQIDFPPAYISLIQKHPPSHKLTCINHCRGNIPFLMYHRIR